MAKLTKEARLVVARLDRIIDEYKEENPSQKRDWRTYEQQYAQRAKRCFSELELLVDEAVSAIQITGGDKRGNESKTTLKQKVLLLLLKHLCSKSNRNMEWMIILFQWLSGINVSYKTIERLYSNELVKLALFNLHILLLNKRGLLKADCCGDGTGYSLCVTQHYASYACRRKDRAKENDENSKEIKYIYSFALMDIKTRMYIGFGTSFKSEKEAFERALLLAKDTEIEINTLRLDKYYSAEAYVSICQKHLGKVKMYILPKKNIASFGLGEWCSMLYRFIDYPKEFLKDYFQRNQSESGFSEDKKRTGWKIAQRLETRVDMAYTLTAVWHNLSWVGADV
jgi:transposase